ncbi:hypothetical protein RFI_26812 [Reticulomyxa filosa]|uniref:Uncharacterized protein n=1 Tax=Reticulomyxa filosa TaxID=46433 RepID=X6MAR1_RETFI|nr:hypothetical protein RFI_26812 [Reticulomyxa filosa]|eukprot:ETO10557.1 hypothetical protein RFI_26812 [Reticulomyxa filosa]
MTTELASTSEDIAKVPEEGRNRNQSEMSHAKTEGEMSRDEKFGTYCCLGRYLLIGAVVLILFGINLAFYLDKERNSFTRQHLKNLNLSTCLTFYYCVTYDANTIKVEWVGKKLSLDDNLVYNESVQEWVLLSGYRTDVLNLSLSAMLLLPPFGRVIPKESYFGIIAYCSAVNDSHTPRPTENNSSSWTTNTSNTRYHYSTWQELSQLDLEHWYVLWSSIGSVKAVGRTSKEIKSLFFFLFVLFFKEECIVVYMNSRFFFHKKKKASLTEISVYTIGITDIRDYVNDKFATYYDTTTDGSQAKTQFAIYDFDSKTWHLQSILWFVPNSDSLKLVLTFCFSSFFCAKTYTYIAKKKQKTKWAYIHF